MCFLYRLSVHWIIYAIIIKIYSIFLNVYSIANNSDSLAGTGLGSHRNWLQGLDSPLIQPNEEDDGQKELKLRFDVSQYNPDEIMVKTVDNKLLVSDVDKYNFNFFSNIFKVSWWQKHNISGAQVQIMCFSKLQPENELRSSVFSTDSTLLCSFKIKYYYDKS